MKNHIQHPVSKEPYSLCGRHGTQTDQAQPATCQPCQRRYYEICAGYRLLTDHGTRMGTRQS